MISGPGSGIRSGPRPVICQARLLAWLLGLAGLAVAQQQPHWPSQKRQTAASSVMVLAMICPSRGVLNSHLSEEQSGSL
jgi:hypothetical protein